MRVRVAHLTPYVPPNRVGGVGVFAAGLHSALLEAGHESEVFTVGPARGRGITALGRRPWVWFVRSAWWALVAGQRFDVVHCQGGEALPAILALRLSRRRHRPRILSTFHVDFRCIGASLRPYTLEGRRFGGGWRPRVYRLLVARLHRLLDALAIRASDAVNAISQSSAREALDDPTAPVIYYGLSAEPKARAAAAEPGSVELLYVGSSGHRKRVTALPFVLRHVRAELPDARLRVVGFVPRAGSELAGLIEELGLADAIDFVPALEAEEVAAYYQRAAVLVLPSAYEGLPLVLLEAMRAGLPVVATRVSGHPEAILDGVTGHLVEVDRPRELAQRCVELLRDPTRRERMGREARRVFEARFGMERQLTAYLGTYRRLIP